MPKRGSGRRVETYFEHDNREEVRRTVSFKQTGSGRAFAGSGSGGIRKLESDRYRRQSNKYNNAIRNHLQLDSDVDMGGGGSAHHGGRGSGGHHAKGGRGGRRGGRQNSPAPMRPNRTLLTSKTHWYKVVLRFAARYDKQWIIDSLLAAVAPITFSAIAYSTQGKDIIFYLDDHKIAQKLMNVDRRISTNDGYKLGVMVLKLDEMRVDVDDQCKELLKIPLNRRFNPDANALDLSRFHSDADLVQKLVPLNQRSVLQCVLTMVVDNCPTLRALDLSHNMLYSLEGLKSLVPKLAHLRILRIEHNQLTYISTLDALKGLDLEELLMDSNPVCGKYQDQGAYVSDIRKRLPKLKRLDGVDLPPPILFDVEETKLPQSRGSFLCAEEGKEMARQFLEQYYAIYDSGNREPLKDAYHTSAMLSMTCSYTPGQSQGNRDKHPLGNYIQNSRNLKRVMDADRRMRHLMCGHEEIMKLLNNLPSSQHDPTSFAVDLLLYTPQLIQLCISGVFREARSSAVRAFSRSLVIVPQGQGFCIINETLAITNATSAQSAVAFKSSLAPVAPAPSVALPVAPLVPVPVAPAALNPQLLQSPEHESRSQMVEQVARASGMNLTWSQKCLDETNWNLERALFVFSQLSAQGVIPAEAFVK